METGLVWISNDFGHILEIIVELFNKIMLVILIRAMSQATGKRASKVDVPTYMYHEYLSLHCDPAKLINKKKVL